MAGDPIRVGVLAIQGAVEEHLAALRRCGVAEPRPVRSTEEIRELDGLIIPGGESTTVGKLMERWGMDQAIQERAAEGMPVFGTCTGMILMAREIEGSDQQRLGLVDMSVRRNAFGRQVDSFESPIEVPEVGEEPVPGVFIRAPFVTHTGAGVEVLGSYGGHPVLVRQGNRIAGAFHPELTDDTRLHEYFLAVVRAHRRHRS
ncbi:MAG TPA: pyridoxal 5'-phosphate synthase glutaminase subunit PdxT [Armatimonadota bacterium]